MRISPIIKTQEDFDSYLETDNIYYKLMSDLVTVYEKLDYSWEILSPVPSDAGLCCILDLEEDISFQGYKIKFN